LFGSGSLRRGRVLIPRGSQALGDDGVDQHLRSVGRSRISEIFRGSEAGARRAISARRRIEANARTVLVVTLVFGSRTRASDLPKQKTPNGAFARGSGADDPVGGRSGRPSLRWRPSTSHRRRRAVCTKRARGRLDKLTSRDDRA
jgi:hypothetical protein